MKKLKPLVLFFFFLSFVLAQERNTATEKKSDSGLHLLLAGGVGNFKVSESTFNSIYSNRSISKIAQLGIGSGTEFLVGRYREFFAKGTSQVVHADAKGKAEWNQKFYSIGIRSKPKPSGFYFDISYVITDFTEKISVSNPEINELAREEKIRAQGIGFVTGISLLPIGPLQFFGEVEYTTMLKLGSSSSGKAIPQIGGLCLSGGIMIII